MRAGLGIGIRGGANENVFVDPAQHIIDFLIARGPERCCHGRFRSGWRERGVAELDQFALYFFLFVG